MTQKLAFLGFGVVGQGLAEILLEKGEKVKAETGFEASVVAISDFRKGSLYHPDGLDLKKALQVIEETGTLDEYPDEDGLTRGWDSITTITESNADTIVEVTFTDVKTGEPAISHCKTAFASGKNVVMTNKGPVALAYQELSALAKENGVRWGFEGTVMSGTPSLRMPLTSLAGNTFHEISGILNGTTNYMLVRMEEGLTYEEALSEAQDLGYAEADPTSDVDGYDALYKVVILANLIMGVPLKTADVERKGLSSLKQEQIEEASQAGKRWKMLGSVKQTEEGVEASVKPVLLERDHPLASIGGATNAITYACDLAGDITLTGAGAGKVETGYSLFIDLLNIHRDQL
ncbi:homoserine dehydrogenase [Shouchella shacheensis]|uniref:homoserine dehydrogenase n=1 Tax=Shouchella shacheensis TaxID=1649580 RepID=UPI0007401552|nr:homoserine dehydrogenase [Shouchella shacheensis]